MSETILVTGACGFTGSNMLEYLENAKPEATVVATDLPGSDRGEYYVEAPASDDPQPVYYEDVIEDLEVEFIPGDLTDPADVTHIVTAFEYDTVFHIASLFDYFAPREQLYAVNVDGTRNLLTALARHSPGCRLIHWSTLGVLGDAGFEEPKTEADGYHPHNRYCESKVAQEQVVRAFQDRLRITILRPGPIYGPRHQYGVYHVLTLVDRLQMVPITTLYPRRRQLQFPCVHVFDLVSAAVYLADHPDAVGETYNVLSDSIGQDRLIRFLTAELSTRAQTLPLPYHLYALCARVIYPLAVKTEAIARMRDTRPLVDAPMIRYLTANMWFSNEKLKATGFEFEYADPRDGLVDYIDWCYDQGYLEPRIEWRSRARDLGSSVREAISRDSDEDGIRPVERVNERVGQPVKQALSRS